MRCEGDPGTDEEESEDKEDKEEAGGVGGSSVPGNVGEESG